MLLQQQQLLFSPPATQKPKNKTNVPPKQWSTIAYNYLYHWLQLKPVGYTFKLEDVRLHAEDSTVVPPPTHKRAWGSVAQKAAKHGLMKKVGLTKARINTKTKNAACALWKKLWLWKHYL